MKNILIAIAIALLASTLHARAETQLDPRTQEYRMWSAERMVERLTERFGRAIAACSRPGGEACKQAANSAYPMFTTIREVATGGDDVQWAKIIDIVHKLEDDTTAPLNALERK